jgi:hypothetical protein
VAPCHSLLRKHSSCAPHDHCSLKTTGQSANGYSETGRTVPMTGSRLPIRKVTIQCDESISRRSLSRLRHLIQLTSPSEPWSLVFGDLEGERPLRWCYNAYRILNLHELYTTPAAICLPGTGCPAMQVGRPSTAEYGCCCMRFPRNDLKIHTATSFGATHIPYWTCWEAC